MQVSRPISDKQCSVHMLSHSESAKIAQIDLPLHPQKDHIVASLGNHRSQKGEFVTHVFSPLASLFASSLSLSMYHTDFLAVFLSWISPTRSYC